MRILMVNWAKIWDGPTVGGGVNGYAQSLCLELTALGHEVAWLSSGTCYSAVGASPETDLGPIHAVRHQDWLGVKVVEIVNSPVLAPSAFQRADADAEVSQPELERVCAEVFFALKPDLIHFHNIEGFSGGCLRVASRGLGDWPGTATLYSLHNYHTLTPEVYLPIKVVSLYEPERVPIDPRTERRVRAGLEEHTPAPEAQSDAVPELVSRLLEPEAREPFEVGGEDPRGMASVLTSHESTAFVPRPMSEKWQPISNDPAAAIDDGFEHRRAAMVGALNTMDRVLAVSDFVRKRFEAEGVEANRTLTMPIGTRAREICDEHPELLFEPPQRVDGSGHRRPLRLVFLGYDHAYKGLHVLADALELIVPELLAELDLAVYAQAGQRSEWRFRRLEPRLAKLVYHHGYGPQDLPWMLGGKDLGVVPSIWWDNGPQTVFELLACGVPVLGADLGGIPDVIRHDTNGLLFGGNDRYDLARQIVRAIREPGLIERLRSGVTPPKSMAEHGREMQMLMLEVINTRTNHTDSRTPRAIGGLV